MKDEKHDQLPYTADWTPESQALQNKINIIKVATVHKAFYIIYVFSSKSSQNEKFQNLKGLSWGEQTPWNKLGCIPECQFAPGHTDLVEFTDSNGVTVRVTFIL